MTLGHLEAGLITCSAFNHLSFSIFCSVSDPDKRLQALWVVCDKLPKNNKTNLRLVKRKVVTAMFLFLVLHETMYPPVLINTHVFMQVSGEVSIQTGSGQRGEQDDSEQHRHRAGTQSAVDQD